MRARLPPRKAREGRRRNERDERPRGRAGKGWVDGRAPSCTPFRGTSASSPPRARRLFFPRFNSSFLFFHHRVSLTSSHPLSISFCLSLENSLPFRVSLPPHPDAELSRMNPEAPELRNVAGSRLRACTHRRLRREGEIHPVKASSRVVHGRFLRSSFALVVSLHPGNVTFASSARPRSSHLQQARSQRAVRRLSHPLRGPPWRTRADKIALRHLNVSVGPFVTPRPRGGTLIR